MLIKTHLIPFIKKMEDIQQTYEWKNLWKKSIVPTNIYEYICFEKKKFKIFKIHLFLGKLKIDFFLKN